MTDLSRTSIGPYTLDREIGRGGMGVVYIARDARLGRDVAVKSLPPHFSEDPERLDRFEREARALAQLNHPNIAGIHGVEDDDTGRRFLILEYVEGDTLGDRLERGPIRLDEAVEICTQIAAGVEAAHEAGVIHRDLKPDNIKITPDGEVKVLDFGLARIDDGSSSTSIPTDPAATVPQQHSTIAGHVMGTPAYMSPEQARGRRVDKRADIWSFGAILYECLTGAKLFVGESAGDTMGAVLHKEMDLSALPASTPPALRRLIERCLERDRRVRYRDIGDVRVDLDRALAPTIEAQRGRMPLWAGAALAVALGLIIGGAAWLTRPATTTPSPQPLTIASVPTPFTFTGSTPWDVSRDGTMLAFSVTDLTSADATHTVYLRRRGSASFEAIYTSTDPGLGVVFTPDSRELMIFERRPANNDRAVRLELESGRAVPVVQAASQDFRFDATNSEMWINDRELLIPGNADGSDYRDLMALDVRTGASRLLVSLPEELGAYHRPQCVTHDGRHLLVATARSGPQTRAIVAAIEAIDLASGEMSTLLDRISFSVSLPAPDVLAYALPTGEMFASRFDQESVTLVGDTIPLAFDASKIRPSRSSGDLVFRPVDTGQGTVGVVSPSGSSEPITPRRQSLIGYNIAATPDAEHIAYAIGNQDTSASMTLILHERSSGNETVIGTGLVYPLRFLHDGRLVYLQVSGEQGAGTFNRGIYSTYTPNLGSRVIYERTRTGVMAAASADRPGLLIPESLGLEGGASADIAYALYDIDRPDQPPIEWSHPGRYSRIAMTDDGSMVGASFNRGPTPALCVSAVPPEGRFKWVTIPGAFAQEVRWSPGGSTLYYRDPTRENAIFAVPIERDESGVPRAASEPRVVLDDPRFARGDFSVLTDGSLVIMEFPESGPQAEFPGLVTGFLDDTRRRLGID